MNTLAFEQSRSRLALPQPPLRCEAQFQALRPAIERLLFEAFRNGVTEHQLFRFIHSEKEKLHEQRH